LRQLAAETGMEVVIIRPPLVYGPGVKANIQTMMRWLQRGIPLPFGANIDISKAKTLLGWTPPISVDEGLRRAAQGFLKGKAA